VVADGAKEGGDLQVQWENLIKRPEVCFGEKNIKKIEIRKEIKK